MKLNKFILFLISLLIPVFVLSGKGFTETQQEVTAVDALGRYVSVKLPIEKILVVGRAAIMPADALYLFPSVHDKEVYLATTDQGLGDFFSLIKPYFKNEKRLAQQVSAEEIIALKPDLVITKTNNYETIGKQLETFNIPLFIMDLETPQAWKDEVVQLGILLGDNDTPKRVIDNFEKREKFVAQKLESLREEEKPKVLITQVAQADGTTAFSVSPKDWIQNQLVTLSKGTPVWIDSKFSSNGWSKISFEQIASWDADYHFLVNYRSATTPFLKEIYSSNKYSHLRSYRDQNILGTPADYTNYFQSDSRWILALLWLSSTLHPQQFSDFDMEKEIKSFYLDFYNISDEKIVETLIDAYRESIKGI
ncbi:MAG: ABC transporter substrate-binding protein [Sphaerochaetaceae bacterium]